MATLLAATVEDATVWIIVCCGGLVALIVAGGAGVFWYRRRWLHGEEGSAEPWTLQDLRDLRARGDLTDEEYEAMRAAMIGTYRRDIDDADASGIDSDPFDSGDRGPDFDLENPHRT